MTVDIGGAASIGRMRIAEPIDVDTTADGNDDDYNGEYDFVDDTPDCAPLKATVDPRIAANSPSKLVAYPDAHPAIKPGVTLGENGAIIVEDGKPAPSSPNHDRSIDINTDPLGTFNDKPNKAAMDKLDALVETAKSANTQPVPAQDNDTDSSCTVSFHTSVGIVVTKCAQWTEVGEWLVLGFDTAASDDRFIPKAGKLEDGSPATLLVTIQNQDGASSTYTIAPVDLQFGLLGSEFLCLLIVDRS